MILHYHQPYRFRENDTRNRTTRAGVMSQLESPVDFHDAVICSVDTLLAFCAATAVISLRPQISTSEGGLAERQDTTAGHQSVVANKVRISFPAT